MGLNSAQLKRGLTTSPNISIQGSATRVCVLKAPNTTLPSVSTESFKPTAALGVGLSGFPDGSAGKESTCNVGDLGSIPGLGRSPGEGKGYLLQYSGLENSMDCIVHGVTKIWT